MILSLVIFIPLIFGLLGAAFAPKHLMKHVALAAVVADLALCLVAAGQFQWSGGPATTTVTIFSSNVPSPFQLREFVPWLHEFEIAYAVGVDHLAMLMLLLSTGLGITAVLCSWTAIEKREKEYYLFLLLLQTGINGTFCALDLFVFYIFWELMLIPLYFLIGIWGSKERIYATMKFLVYTLVGSLLMLLAILWMYYNGAHTYSYEKMLHLVRSTGMWQLTFWPFLALFLAFAIKVPLFPFHTWLPDAHTEAPTAGSVVLAGVLLKTGVFGMLRYCLPLFPTAAVQFAPTITWLAVIAIVYGAMTAMVQKDMKRLVAYSSVSHMGYIILGIFSFNMQGMSGAILQMINHGISTGGLFLAVGMIYERRHTREMSEFGGLAHNLPVFAALTMMMVLSSVGLPGLNGFVGEFTILMGSMKSAAVIGEAITDPTSLAAMLHQQNYSWFIAAVAGTGVIFGAVYLLIMYQKTFFGKLDNEKNKHLPDLNAREWLQLGALSVAAVVIGLWPNLLFRPIDKSSKAILDGVTPSLSVSLREVQLASTDPKPAELAQAE